MRITKLGYHDENGNPQRAIIGMGGVKEISQHSAMGEGDKWYWEIVYEDGRITVVFDAKVVEHTPDKQEVKCPF